LESAPGRFARGEMMGLKDRIVKALAMRWIKGKIADPKGTAGQVWRFLDGWKLMIGVAVMFGCAVYDALHNGHSGAPVSAILSTLGWLPPGEWTGEAMTKAAGGAIALVGFAWKLWKAQQQRRAGVPAIDLLSGQ
jgi:hypothetical protein